MGGRSSAFACLVALQGGRGGAGDRGLGRAAALLCPADPPAQRHAGHRRHLPAASRRAEAGAGGRQAGKRGDRAAHMAGWGPSHACCMLCLEVAWGAAVACAARTQTTRQPSPGSPAPADEEGALAPLRAARSLLELRLPDGALSGVPDVVADLPQLTLLSFRGVRLGVARRSLRFWVVGPPWDRAQPPSLCRRPCRLRPSPCLASPRLSTSHVMRALPGALLTPRLRQTGGLWRGLHGEARPLPAAGRPAAPAVGARPLAHAAPCCVLPCRGLPVHQRMPDGLPCAHLLACARRPPRPLTCQGRVSQP